MQNGYQVTERYLWDMGYWDTCHMVMVIKTKEVIDNFFSILNLVIRHSVTFGSFKYSL